MGNCRLISQAGTQVDERESLERNGLVDGDVVTAVIKSFNPELLEIRSFPDTEHPDSWELHYDGHEITEIRTGFDGEAWLSESLEHVCVKKRRDSGIDEYSVDELLDQHLSSCTRMKQLRSTD